jgi:NAD(P)-dependent dehydrogenase (short-subunit alcohol dehydrogenase family)
MGILDGKAVVVTGAGRGLGRAYALHIAEAGAGVVVNDVETGPAGEVAAAIRAAGGRAVAQPGSVADPDVARALVHRCVAEFGSVDGLVNNAALTYEAMPWEERPERIRELVEVNVLGVLYCGTAAAAVMRAAGGGVIVNICSGASLGQRTIATYAASKGAVAALTYSWALDLEAAGIRVNAVAPLAYTRMVEDSARARANCPPTRTPDRIAPLVTFLLSDRSAGITGQLIRFTGPQLHVVGQPYFKKPILARDAWDVADISAVFEDVFGQLLEPYGMEKRLPPRLRAPVPAAATLS